MESSSPDDCILSTLANKVNCTALTLSRRLVSL
jgi:hypothetical protein